VAWRVQLMACKFLDANGDGFNSDAVACIEFARTNGAHVINLSWGDAAFSEAVSNAIWFARADGILVVAAAGNNARNTDVIPYYPASIALDNLVAVGASTRLDGTRTSSNFGAGSVDLFAPGEAIYSTVAASDTAYESRNGSSMATAFVAGALALLRAESPTAPGTQLIARLLAATDPAPAFAGKCVSGGRLNLRKIFDRPRVALLPGDWPVEIRVEGVASHSYVLSASSNLTSWTALQTNVASGDGGWTYTDNASTNFPHRFYRAAPRP
jgi:subtilisin family serine protease